MHVPLCVCYVYARALRGQKPVSDPLELELKPFSGMM